jgi:hypothetical protein
MANSANEPPPGTQCEWCPAPRSKAAAPSESVRDEALTHYEWCGAEYPVPAMRIRRRSASESPATNKELHRKSGHRDGCPGHRTEQQRTQSGATHIAKMRTQTDRGQRDGNQHN